MMTVNQVSKLTGVSIRTLHYYDNIGLLVPEQVTDAGYRMYGTAALERLQQILLFKELEFSLSDIKKIIDSPDFDRKEALSQQLELLKIKREHINELISFTQGLVETGVNTMDFSAFDKKKTEEYTRKAKKEWGDTSAYREFEKKTENYSDTKNKALSLELMNFFVRLGKMQDKSPTDPQVQETVKELQSFITENYYTCDRQIFSCLGQMYSAGGEMTENINSAGGANTAEFVSNAIQYYCNRE